MSVDADQLTVTTQQRHGTAATVEIDEESIARTDVHRALFDPAQSDLPQQLLEAAAEITPIRGGHSDAVRDLEARGVDALDGRFAAAVASGLVQEDHGGSHDHGRDDWVRMFWLARHIHAQDGASTEDIYDGPVALLAQLEQSPTIEVQIPSSFVTDHAQQQRSRLLGYLRRLTPGVDVYITGSRLALQKLIDHHAADLPGDVSERTQRRLTSGSHVDRERQRGSKEVAQDAIDDLGLGDRQAGYWRLLTRVCADDDGRVAQSSLEGDVLLDDVDGSTIRRRAGRLADAGLLERSTDGGQRYLEPTAAGQHALTLAQSETSSLLSCWSTGDTSSGHAETETEDQTAGVSDPPKSTAEPCTPNAREWGEDGDRPTAEGRAASRGGSGSSTPTTRYLGRDEHHAAAAAVPDDGGFALSERPVGEIPDARDSAWSYNEDRDEVVVEVAASPALAVTMVRLCDALLSEKALSQLLTPEKLNGGPGKFDLEGLAISRPVLLRQGRTFGWLKNIDAEGGRFLDRLQQARNELTQELADAADTAENGRYDEDDLSHILRKAHGLQGVLVGLYDMLGVDVVRSLKIPDPWTMDAGALAECLHHQTMCSSRYGIYTAQRYLAEPRDEKREDTLSPAGIDAGDDYRGTVSGSWVITAPSTGEIEEALQNPKNQPDLQEDGEAYFEFVLDLDVVDADRREAVGAAAARLLPTKNLRPDREMLTTLHTMTGSTAAAAAAIIGMGRADERRRLDHGDLERGLWTLGAVDEDGEPYFEHVDETQILPEVGGAVVSKAIWTLLQRDNRYLSKSAVAERADISTQSLRTETNQDALTTLEALGILEIEETGAGKADQWSFSFPGQDSSAGHGVGGKTAHTDDGVEMVDQTPVDQLIFDEDGIRFSKATFELVMALESVWRLDAGIDMISDAAMAAWGSPPADHDPLWKAASRLRPLLRLLADLFERDLGRIDTTVSIGEMPDAVMQQQSLSAAAAD